MSIRRHSVRGGSRFLLGFGLVVMGGAAFAAPPVLTVKALRDAGGTLPKANNELPLNVRYAQALRGRIKDAAKQSLRIAGLDPEDKTPTTRYTVEGDLSRAETKNENASAYLCILRVFKEGKPRQLVMQLAGTADTLRDLTGNLRQDPNINPNGLAGDFAARIVAALTPADATGAFLDMAKKAAELKHLTVTIRTENAAGKQEAGQGLETGKGEKFRLCVTSQDRGAVYLVEMTDGKPVSAFVPEDPLEVAPGRSVILPPDAPFDSARKAYRDFVVLVRVGRRVTLTPNDRGTKCPFQKNADHLAVQVLSSGDTNTPENAPDGGVKRLLAMYRQDGEGAWMALRVRVHFTEP